MTDLMSGGSTRSPGSNPWPALPALADWQKTLDTVHMWSQIVGKIRLELAPWVNHSWGSTLYVTTRGLTTSPIPYEGRSFTIDFDFASHALAVRTSDGAERAFALRPMTVADFYRQVMETLDELGIRVEIYPRPVEVEVAIPFASNTTNACYDADAMHRFWQALVQADRVMKEFRADYAGKGSPVHLFWGSFDLAVTRFSGRTAPKHPGGAPNCPDWVMEEAYSHELYSAGFWAGPGLGEAAFYAYAYPAGDGFAQAAVQPEAAYYYQELGEFVLPYEAVRTADSPDDALMAFLQSTYNAAADAGNWDRAVLDYDFQRPDR